MKGLCVLGHALADTVQDDNGGYSTLRLSLCVLQVVILGAWITGMFVEGRYLSLGPNEAALLGTGYGAKVVQRYFERQPMPSLRETLNPEKDHEPAGY